MNGISERIRRHIETRVGVHTAYAREGEARTRIALIDPFLRDVLNYDPSIPTQVVVENIADVRGRGTRNKADYALMQNGQPLVIVEAKSADGSLAGAVEQLNGYLHGTRSARFGICTNGLGYHFYKLDSDKRYMETEPFFTVDLQRGNPAEDSDVAHLLAMFAREDFNPEGIEKWADLRNRRTAIKSRLQEELTNPSDGMVRLLVGKVDKAELRESQSIVQEVARDFLGLSLTAPDRTQGLASSASPPAGYALHRQPTSPASDGDSQGIPIRTTIPGQPNQYYHGRLLEGGQGRVRLSEGSEFDNPSAARRHLVPIHKRYPNGWTRWKYFDQQDQRHQPIGRLRGLSDEEQMRRAGASIGSVSPPHPRSPRA